jgi:hypothetical protein
MLLMIVDDPHGFGQRGIPLLDMGILTGERGVSGVYRRGTALVELERKRLPRPPLRRLRQEGPNAFQHSRRRGRGVASG